MSILYILLVLVVAGVILWAAKAVLAAPGMIIADPLKTVIWVVIVLFVCLFVLQSLFGVLPGVPTLRVWR